MPTYSYKCKQGHMTTDFQQRIGLKKDSLTCSECGENSEPCIDLAPRHKQYTARKTGFIASNGKGNRFFESPFQGQKG